MRASRAQPSRSRETRVPPIRGAARAAATISTRPSYLGARARSPNKSNLAITLAYSDHWRMRQLPRAGTHIAVGRGNSRVFVSGRLQDLGFAGTSSPWWEVRRSQPRVRATTGPGEPSWSFPRPPRQGHATAGWIPGRVSVTSLTDVNDRHEASAPTNGNA